MEFEGEFSDLNLNSWLLNHLNRLGFKRPTPIQYNCIPTILQGRLLYYFVKIFII